MNTLKISKGKLHRIVGKFPKSTILVIGDVMVDEYIWGDVRRISPEAPVPVVAVDTNSYRLGGATNVLQNLKSVGTNPVMCSVIGNDASGEKLRQILEEMGCPVGGLYVSKRRPTTIKTRVMASHQQICRIDREASEELSEDEYKFLWDFFVRMLPKASGIIISDYAKGVVSQPLIGKILVECRKRNLFVAVDPKERHFDLYKGVSVITPNLKEAHTVLGTPYNHSASDDEIKSLGWRIVEKLDCACLLITLSERGMALFDRSKNILTRLPTVARKVYDVTGAGDTVIGVYTAAITCGATPVEAAFLANTAAGVTVGELGTASVSPKVLLDACDEQL